MIFNDSTTPGTTSGSGGIQVFSVFANDDEVHTVSGWSRGQVPDGPQIRKQVQRLSQADVDAREALSDRRGDGALERDLVPLDGASSARGSVLYLVEGDDPAS